MNTTPRPRTPSVPRPKGALRRGLGAAGAAVAVAFVGTAGLGASEAHAAGIGGGLSYAAHDLRPPAPAAHPANLPAATTTAVRYEFRNGQLVEL